jgi:uncharacterized LabA/DUF88 family protein
MLQILAWHTQLLNLHQSSLQLSHPKWELFDFPRMFNSALASYPFDRVIFYFAKIKFHPQSPDKSNELIQEQRLLKTALESHGYTVELAGSVRGNADARGRMVFKEKGVDVRIAVDMVSMACDGTVNEIILCSSDSDLQPAIRESRRRGTPVLYLGFEANPNKGMTYTTKRTILIRDSEVQDSMPGTIL